MRAAGRRGDDVRRAVRRAGRGRGRHRPAFLHGHRDLDGRTVKDVNNHAYPNRYFDGQYVEITCQDSGPSAYGSTIWDLTYEGLWIPDFYVSTGSTGFSTALPRCTSGGGGSTDGHSYVVTATLDGRTAKSLSNHAYPDKYPSASTVTITCQAYGEFTYGGSAIWDKTTDGLWVVDYYVKTGTDASAGRRRPVGLGPRYAGPAVLQPPGQGQRGDRGRPRRDHQPPALRVGRRPRRQPGPDPRFLRRGERLRLPGALRRVPADRLRLLGTHAVGLLHGDERRHRPGDDV
jgi:hypothetical protein